MSTRYGTLGWQLRLTRVKDGDSYILRMYNGNLGNELSDFLGDEPGEVIGTVTQHSGRASHSIPQLEQEAVDAVGIQDYQRIRAEERIALIYADRNIPVDLRSLSRQAAVLAEELNLQRP